MQRIFVIGVSGTRPLFLLAAAVSVVSLQPAMVNSEYFGSGEKQLTYGDVIVRGTIRNVETTYAKEADYFLEPDRPGWPLAVTFIGIDVVEVLRGPADLTYVTAAAPGGFPPGVPDTSGAIHSMYGYGFQFTQGQDVVYCLWHDRLDPTSYRVPPDEGRFVRMGDRWINQATNSSYDLATIRRIVRQGQASELRAQSDVVVIGSVVTVSCTDRVEYGPVTQHVRITIDELLKGTYSNDSLTFSFTKIGGPDTAPTPDISVGEQWVIFLRRDDGVFRPVGGLNGMLQVAGDKLLRNNHVTYELNKKQLRSMMIEEVDHDH